MAKTKPQDASASRESTAIQKAAMLAALEKSLGVVTTAAKAVGISREAHRLWMHSDPEYAEKVQTLKDVKLDFLESMAHKRVNEGSDTMIIFLLKTQGKDRGYIERQDLRVTNTYETKTDEDIENELKELEGK